MESIQFRFSGGMADDCQLNFYEAGRFQYGAARFIYTLEKFRQEGLVAKRLTGKVKADIRVNASTPGSFIQNVVMLALPVVAECAVKVPFDAMMAYVWDLLLPSTKSQDIAVELAKAEVAREAERTQQERERTKQAGLFLEVSKSGNANTSKALEVIGSLIEQKAAGTELAQDISVDELQRHRRSLRAKQNREELISNNYVEFEKIDLLKQRKLTGQMRNSVRDMTLPLRSSANILAVGTAAAENRYAHIDPSAALSITDQVEDSVPTPLRGSVKMYDVETGFGKFRWPEYEQPINFRVPTALRSHLRDKILDTMKEKDVFVAFYIVRDFHGSPVYLILDNLIAEEPSSYEENV